MKHIGCIGRLRIEDAHFSGLGDMSRTDLHWSFNHDRKEQAPYFAEQLRTLVKGALDASPDEGEVSRYTYLPNFARGFKGNTGRTADGYDLSVGDVVIRRRPEGQDRLDYSVVSSNATNGEHLNLKFTTGTDAFRTLIGSWSVNVENCAGDGYKGFSCDGRLEKDGSVFLTTNGLDLLTGSVDLAAPLSCNWALFDVIPELAVGLRESREAQQLTILEDLEKVRNNAQIQFLESYDLPLDNESIALMGYSLIAEGMTPSYWWLDARGRVLIAANLFQTLILTGGEHA